MPLSTKNDIVSDGEKRYSAKEFVMLVSEKLEAEKIIKHLPESATFEDIQYHIYVAEKLKNSRPDIVDGKVHTQAAVEKRLGKWIIK